MVQCCAISGSLHTALLLPLHAPCHAPGSEAAVVAYVLRHVFGIQSTTAQSTHTTFVTAEVQAMMIAIYSGYWLSTHWSMVSATLVLCCITVVRSAAVLWGATKYTHSRDHQHVQPC